MQRRAVERRAAPPPGISRVVELVDERVLLEDLRVAPARGPIELRDDGRRVVAPHLVDAILVAVEREQAPVAAHAHAVERVEHAIGRQPGVGRWRRVHGQGGCDIGGFYVASCGTTLTSAQRHARACARRRFAIVRPSHSGFRHADPESARTHRPPVGRRNRPAARRLHPHSREVAALRSAWEANGHIERVIRLAERGRARSRCAASPSRSCACRAARRCCSSRCRGSGRRRRTVLLYGHLDKQPEMVGWREGFGPWTPVHRGRQALRPRRRRRRLCGVRGAVPRSARCRREGVAHARCVGMIETCEESGSYDLPAYLDALRRGSARSISSSASTRAAATTSGCG